MGAGFIGGMCGWLFILFEIFLGEAGGMAGQCSEAVKTSFNNMRLIVTLGWSIYPLGYYFGYLLGSVSDESLNVTSTLQISSTRLLSCFHVGPAQSLKRRTPCCLEANEATEALS